MKDTGRILAIGNTKMPTKTGSKRKSGDESDKENNTKTTKSQQSKTSKSSKPSEDAKEPKKSENGSTAKQSQKRKSDAITADDLDLSPAGSTSKKAKPSPSSGGGSSSNNSSNRNSKSTKSSNKKESDDLSKWDISDIHLDGEENNKVPVYDTCSDIRTKIRNHLKNAPKKLGTQASLARELSKCIGPENQHERWKTDNISPRNLTTFQKKTGPCGGGTSPVFYASYVYFEKLRLKQNKKKSQKREEMEKEWGNTGVDFADSDANMLMRGDESVEITKYGRMNFVRM